MLTAVTVRALTNQDAPLMRKMLDLFGEAFADQSSYRSKQPDDAYLASLLACDTFIAVCALDRDDVIGGLAGYLLPKFEQKRSEFYIYDLAVAAARRRQGVATALMAELDRIAAARGIDVIFVQADPEDDAAIALYTKLGVREDVLHFDIRVAARPRE